jgi:hypothetical protein
MMREIACSLREWRKVDELVQNSGLYFNKFAARYRCYRNVGKNLYLCVLHCVVTTSSGCKIDLFEGKENIDSVLKLLSPKKHVNLNQRDLSLLKWMSVDCEN